MKSTIFLIILTCIVYFSCTENDSDIKQIIYSAGENRNELEKILAHYRRNHNEPGLKAAKFIISNISLLGTKDIESNLFSTDINHISAKYLISNIDLSLKTSQYILSNNKISFNDFCEYILPHRVGEEKLIAWRQKCLNQYRSVTNLVNSGNINRALFTINDSLRKHFSFTYNCLPAQYCNWEQLAYTMKGDCWTMNTTSLYPLRALGIPVTIDFVPSWGNTNGGSHAWSVLINSNDIFFPFMGCESTSLGYNPLNIYYQKRLPPKVFRRVFSLDSSVNMILDSETRNFFPSIGKSRVIDVTDKYVTTLNVKINNNKLNGYKVAFLCVFSNGRWKPVFWSNTKGNSCYFKKMATEILYVPSVWSNHAMQPIGPPFYLSKEKKSIITFKTNTNDYRSINLCIKHLQSKALDEQTVYTLPRTGTEFFKTMDSVKADLRRSHPIDYKRYSLFYYKNGWKRHSSLTKFPHKSLTFKRVPFNSIYKIVPEDSTGKERIFTISNSSQVWW